MSLQWQEIALEEGSLGKTPCDCCGKTTMVIEGDLFYQDDWFSFYSVRFVPGHLHAYPFFQIGTGDWSNDARNENRWMFGAEYVAESEGFSLVDIKDDTQQQNYTALNRSDVIGTHFAQEALAMLDAIFMKDSRLEVLRNVAH